MPTENERKYVLRNSKHLLRRLELEKHSKQFIIQRYIHKGKSWNARIRKISESLNEYYTFTYKNSNFGRVIEVESEITKDDFYDLSNNCISELKKIRYKFETEQYTWEIDTFIKDLDEIYFVLAEVELSETEIEPSEILDIVSDNLLYAVPLDDNRFNNFKLTDINYTDRLYEVLLDRG